MPLGAMCTHCSLNVHLGNLKNPLKIDKKTHKRKEVIMQNIKRQPGNLIPGLEVEVFEYGSKTLKNTNKELHQFKFGITLKRELGNLAVKLVLLKFLIELENIASNVQPKELTKWWK